MSEKGASCAFSDEILHHAEKHYLDVGKAPAVELQQSLVGTVIRQSENIGSRMVKDALQLVIP